jgi:hypothetical protein
MGLTMGFMINWIFNELDFPIVLVFILGLTMGFSYWVEYYGA